MIDRLNQALTGRYRIERELGEGGMAIVFLATDVRHSRPVAVKVLKPALAAVLGAERFLAEIETTAALQHPHILPLFDSGEADGFLFYVMPFVEGESLRERLDREKQLRVEEAVELTRKVAEALDYAHEQGIVHRDVKPANILLSARGEPLVADFGIALAISQAGGGRITETGLSLGTPHYMSPEQATGDRAVDHRSDVYALGCVLYEMLAGQSPFAAPTAQAVLARILTEDARDVAEVRRTVPPHVAAAVARALEKLPADRFESAAAFREALGDERFRYEPVRRTGAAGASGRAGPSAPEGAAVPGRWISRPASIAALGALALLGIAAAAGAMRDARPPDPVEAARALPAWRFELPGGLFPENGIDLGPDGTLVLGGETEDGGLHVRAPGEARTRFLPGTERGFHPSVSPDGEWVAFTTGEELRKIPLGGGPVVRLATSPGGPLITPHWGPDGTIAFVVIDDGLYRVPDVGGQAERVYEAEEGRQPLAPFILPDGAGWLITEGVGVGGIDAALLHLDPATGETRVVAEGGGSAVWVPTGDVAFVHTSGSLFAASFDLETGDFTTAPAPVQDSVRTSYVIRPFVTSASGAAAYLSGGSIDINDGRIVLMDATGEGADERPPLEPATHWDGRFSPDGRRIAYTTEDHIRVYDLELGTNLRLTTEGSNHHDPVWSPDGARIAFGSERDTTGVDLWVKDAAGREQATPVLRLPGDQYLTAWTDDGRLLFSTDHLGNWDLFTVPVDGEGEPRPYLRADWDEQGGRVSPDGRWLAYVSSDTDPTSIVIRAFPDPGRAHRVSEEGASAPAAQPVWSPDGRTLYYRQGADLIAAELETDGAPTVLARRELGSFAGLLRDVHPDGERLLTFQFGRAGSDADASTRLVVVANWFSELAERLGRERR